MLYNFLTPYAAESHIANLFRYITFRGGLAIIVSLSFCFLFGPRLIRYLRASQKLGQPIREDGPETHKSKAGTPTMGGLMMIGGILVSTFTLADLTNPYIWITLFVLVSFALLGFMDDYLKVSKRNTKGVSGKMKMLVQFLVSIISCLLIQYYSATGHETHLAFPFFKNFLLDLGVFYIPFVAIVIIGSSNAVNLTDGLDGLASVPIAITALCFGIFSYVVGNVIFANYLQLIYVPHVGELAIICAAIVGSSLGFLWFNAQPAEVFMGDTGSLSLGGALGVISVIIKHEIVLAIVGGLFVIEALSVIIQVYYFKITKGKRIFKMAPLHHHFEKAGWPESKVVVRFWILGVIFGLIGLATLKLR
ncbi:MAG: mraY [Rickettsiaceae bacterium]|jgi:phospho-N-acetylmuramoyl-pentapeptide-transferase|nr:mraY [Rickettsiaceae bacterium]